MNMIDVQDKLKNLSEDQLIREMQAPSAVLGSVRDHPTQADA